MSLITASALQARLGSPDWRLVDATYYLGRPVDDALAAYRQRHLPGAVFFDIDAIANKQQSLPHMLPTLDAFADAMARLDVRPEHQVVVYDAQGMFSSPRVWWTLRHFGYEHVAVLDGGLPAWLAGGGTTEAGNPPPLLENPVPITGLVEKPDVATRQSLSHYLSESLQAPTAVPRYAGIVDARSAERFEGRVDEPRPGLRRGHIPTSVNVPWDQLIDPDTKRLKPGLPDVMATLQNGQNGQPIVCTCGSGMTACILALAFNQAGVNNIAIYDGSWAEWGADPALPVV